MDHQPHVPLPPAQAAEELAAIVRSSPFAIFSLALDGTVLTWNSGTEQLYGISAAEAIGANFGDMLPESMTSNSTWAADAARRGESVINNEVRRTLPDGRVLDLSASMAPIFADDGTVKSAAFVVIDVSPLRSAERRLEESLGELQDSVYRDHLTGVGSRERWQADGAVLIDFDQHASGTEKQHGSKLRIRAGSQDQFVAVRANHRLDGDAEEIRRPHGLANRVIRGPYGCVVRQV